MPISPGSALPSEERQALLVAALEVLRERGAHGLRVDDVLTRAGLGTRAFYRHFASKDQLILDVFAAAAQAEADRLRSQIREDQNALSAITAWIDGRLDLAFDAEVSSDLQYVSRQAQAVNVTSPERMAAVHAAILAPLIEHLARAAQTGEIQCADPVADALSIDAVTWSCIERQWAGAGDDPATARAQVRGFCLRAIGAQQ